MTDWNSARIDHDPPKSLAAMNRSMSDFLWTNPPTREIDVAIVWLQEMVTDCQFKIDRLQALKNDRERARAHADKIDGLAALFDDPDFLNIDYDNQIRIIMQRIGCDWDRAEAIRDHTVKKLKAQKRRARDAEIIAMHLAGLSDIKIAARVGLTRQQVYNIRKKST